MKLFIATLYVLVLCVAAAPLSAETSSFLGVLLDQKPLPSLLAKHLQLPPDQGVLVQNILIDSPADKAGLDKDDIIVTLDDQPVTGFLTLTRMIQAAPAGQDVTFGVIQSGRLNNVTVRLEAGTPGTHWGKWKYMPQTESSQILRHRIFRLDPDKMPNISGAANNSLKDLIEQFSASYVYHYQHSLGADQFTVSIKGNPKQADTPVIVKAGRDQYSVTVGTVDQLPEKFRKAVQEDIEKSIEYKVDFKGHEIEIPFNGNFNFQAFPFSPDEAVTPGSPKVSDPELNKLQEQLEQLKEQLKKKDQEWQQRLDRLEKMLSRKQELSA